MPYEVLDHTADAVVRGVGASWEEAFAEAARAMFSLMVELDQVELKETVEIKASAEDLGALLVAWLGELLTQRDLRGMVFARFRPRIYRTQQGWRLVGQAHGEALDRARHRLGVEVKAATYAGLKVEEKDGRYVAQCVVDL